MKKCEITIDKIQCLCYTKSSKQQIQTKDNKMSKETISISPAETVNEEMMSWDRQRSAGELRKFVLERLQAIGNTEDILV